MDNISEENSKLLGNSYEVPEDNRVANAITIAAELYDFVGTK